MTEQSLLLKCDFADRYFIVGTDFPSARVFDTTASSLAAVVELPRRSRNISLNALTLTAVAIRQVNADAGNTADTARHRAEQLLDDHVAPYYAAVGLSNGTLLLHDVRRDVLVAHVQVSETRQPLLSLQLCGDFVFCLAANNVLYAVRLLDAASGPCLRVRVQADASCLAATEVLPSETTEGTAHAQRTCRVMVAGPTNALYEVRTVAQPHRHNGRRDSAAVPSSDPQPPVHATKLLAFPSQGSAAEFAWVSDHPVDQHRHGAGAALAALPAVTASAQEGVIRVWDVRYDASPVAAASTLMSENASATAGAVVARCRRTLLCGQRILNVSVLTDVSPATKILSNKRADTTAESETVARTRCGSNWIAATTLTGAILLWSLGEALLPEVVEPVPLKPDVVLVSAVPAGRLLFGSLRPAQQRIQDGPNGTASSDAASTHSGNVLHGLEVTMLRGRFALPMFEAKNIGAAVEAAGRHTIAGSAKPSAATGAATANSDTRRATLASLALGVAGTSSGVTVVELPLSSSSVAALAEHKDAAYLLEQTTDAATSSFVVMDTVWAAHQRQVASKARQSMTEAFKAPQLYHAKSIQDLPVKQLTLEQRLQQVAREEQAAARQRKANNVMADAERDQLGEDEEASGQGGRRSVLSHHALGLATIPLYQALHANDTSAVMDLLNMSARSAEGMRATVLSLQLPYCLQLLQVISERLGLVSKAVEKAAPAAGAVDAERKKNSRSSNATARTEVEGNKASGEADNEVHPEKAVAARETEHDATSTPGVLRGGVAAFSVRSSLLEWIDAILNYRGSELLSVQREWNARVARQAAGLATPDDAAADLVSPPKDFLAPILHHYQSLCSQYDKLAVLYGRLSIFKSVRPSQKNEFTNVPRSSHGSNMELARPTLASSNSASGKTRRLHLAEKSSVVDSDIIFPVMFQESRGRTGHRVVRVRSKLEIQKKKQQRANRDAALQRRARAAALQDMKAKAAKGQRSILDDDNSKGGLGVMDQIMMEELKSGQTGELDLDALEAMDLNGDSDLDMSGEDDDDELEEEAETEDDDEDIPRSVRRRRPDKRARKEAAAAAAAAEMLADDGNGEDDEDDGSEKDADEALDSSEAEFSSASDDDVDSDVLDLEAEEEEEEDDDSDVDEDENLREESGEESDADDGLGEDMRDLLTRHENDEDRTDRRKSKKVRTD